MASKMPTGDKWELIDVDINSEHNRKVFKFDFSYIKSDSIKNIAKVYTWRNYKEGNLTLASIHKYMAYNFKQIVNFLDIQGINSLKDLSNNDIDNFISYLNTLISPKGKVYTIKSRKAYLDVLKNIIRWGQIYMPNEVPKTEIFTGNEYTGVNKKLKIDFIPDEVLEQINKALKNEKNPYVKYGIIILQSTGMRMGDLLKLTTDCLKPDLISGYTLTWYEHKTRKQRQPMPIHNECARAIENLIKYTKELREEANDNIKDYLFINKPSCGRYANITNIIPKETFRGWLDKFTKNNNIIDSDGECYNLTSHQFRRTLATDMFSKGTDLNVIQTVLGHSSPSTTKQNYADVKDKERAEVFKNIGIIGNINNVDETIISDKNDLTWFKENKDKGARMEDGYCTKPCSEGKICERLLKRKKCYSCSRYITTPEYLQAHKDYLAELEKQLEENIYGDHYAKHIIPTIEILKEIIKRLEEIQDGDN